MTYESRSTPVDGCTCQACSALAARYDSATKGGLYGHPQVADPGLLAFYRRRLLVRGWAGHTDAVEKAYILAHAEWARGSAERGRANLARYPKFGQKVHTGTASSPEVISDHMEA